MKTFRWLMGDRGSRSRFFYLLALGFFWTGLGGEGWAAAPSITKISLLPTRQLELELAVEVGKSYTFEISTNMVDWEAIGGIESAPASTITISDTDTVDMTPVMFFRLKEGRFTSFGFWLAHYAPAGQFVGGGMTPTVNLPVSFQGYSAGFDAEGDAPYPPPSQVLFTGPAGSGLSAAPASEEYSETDDEGAWYISPNMPSTFGAPTGTWTVNYRGTNITFTSNLDALSRLVLPVPTVQVTEGMLRSVSWVYRDRVTGVALNSPPSYMREIMLQIEGLSGRIYDSPDGDLPSVTTHTLSTPIPWSDVTGVNLAYDDSDDNHYVIFYWRQ